MRGAAAVLVPAVWWVHVPAGTYMARLPPPGPSHGLWLRVSLADESCTAVPPPPTPSR
jgi:hypothetical protein